MSCQICVEVCPFDAIEMDTAFELSTDNRFGGLLWRKAQLAKSNDYFHHIHPIGAAEVDERLSAAKVKAEAKTSSTPKTSSSSSSLPQPESAPDTRDSPMAETVDQIFVILKHWLVGHLPVGIQPAFAAVISVVSIIVVFASLFAVTTILERKGLGRFQNRYGPNRVGPYGLLQPLADGLKSLTKEDIVPNTADKTVHFLAPVVLVVAAFMGYAVLPLGRNMIAVNLDAGVLYFFAAGSVVELSIFMAGWSSRNKYSLLGAMRAIAQMISYEIPLILSAVTVIMTVGSLSTATIVEQQAGYSGIWPHWLFLRHGDSPGLYFS